MPNFFDELVGVQVAPDRTIIPVKDLYSQAGAILPQLAGSEIAYNQALAPGLTDVGLGVEEQVSPGAFGLRRSALAQLQKNLDLGYRLPPELQDLVTTNALQQLGTSGVGASDLGKIFGARSIAGAGLDYGQRNLGNALQASQYQQYFQPRQPYGQTPGNDLVSAISQTQAATDDYNNLIKDINMQNSSAWIKKGLEIVGTAVGGYFGGPQGAQAGAEMGRNAYGGSRVAGYQNRGQQQQGGGGMGGFGSILSGIGGGGGGMGGGGGGTAPGSSYTGADSGIGFGGGSQGGMMYA